MRAASALLLVLVSAGCATVAKGPSQEIAVSTTPPGARVITDCARVVREGGLTPTTVSVSRSAQPCEVAVALGGRQARTALARRITPQFWWNLLWAPAISLAAHAAYDEGAGGAVGGLVLAMLGMAVDGATGAMYRRTPAEIEIVLPQLHESSSPPDTRRAP